MYALVINPIFLELQSMISNKDKEYLEAFGKNLRRLRKESQLSQEELSEKMGTAPSQVGRIERGVVNPTVSTLKVLSEALGCDIKELFNFDYS